MFSKEHLPVFDACFSSPLILLLLYLIKHSSPELHGVLVYLFDPFPCDNTSVHYIMCFLIENMVQPFQNEEVFFVGFLKCWGIVLKMCLPVNCELAIKKNYNSIEYQSSTMEMYIFPNYNILSGRMLDNETIEMASLLFSLYLLPIG